MLKADVFGTITRIGNTVLRDTRPARPWARLLARRLLQREQRALTRLAQHEGQDGGLGIPHVLAAGRGTLTRSWIEATPMHIAKPRDPNYFVAAARLVRRLHAANVIHNDLAKEANWLVTPDGRPAIVDFQLAMTASPRLAMKSSRRGALARALGRDDIRHLLKHKRSYLPELLTAREQRILATPSAASRIWMATGKKAYLFVTRKILHWRDREGAGDRV